MDDQRVFEEGRKYVFLDVSLYWSRRVLSHPQVKELPAIFLRELNESYIFGNGATPNGCYNRIVIDKGRVGRVNEHGEITVNGGSALTTLECVPKELGFIGFEPAEVEEWEKILNNA